MACACGLPLLFSAPARRTTARRATSRHAVPAAAATAVRVAASEASVPQACLAHASQPGAEARQVDVGVAVAAVAPAQGGCAGPPRPGGCACAPLLPSWPVWRGTRRAGPGGGRAARGHLVRCVMRTLFGVYFGAARSDERVGAFLRPTCALRSFLRDGSLRVGVCRDDVEHVSQRQAAPRAVPSSYASRESC